MQISNNTNNCEKFNSALKFLNFTKELNVIMVFIIILIGLVGNILAILVFIQKRFRKKSTEVFLLVLAISDGLFLITHFFEDTLRTYIDFYVRNNRAMIPFPYQHCNPNVTIVDSSKKNEQSIYELINITDKFEVTCVLVNYFRYFLRFISAYIITLFTIQRTISIYKPIYQNKFSSPELAWKVVLSLIFIGGLFCSFVPYFFHLQKDSSNAVTVVYCDIDRNREKLYYYTRATIFYITIIMLIPITAIIVSNSLIIIQIYKARKKRKQLFSIDKINKQKKLRRNYSIQETNFNNQHDDILSDQTFDIDDIDERTKPYVLRHFLTIRFKKFNDNSQRVTHMLVLMSLSFAILNLPYFVTWCMFFYNEAFKNKNVSDLELTGFLHSKYFFGFINIAETIYISNYGIHFYLYCASGKQFRRYLRTSLFSSNTD